PGEEHLPRGWAIESAQEVEQRRLAHAGRSDQRHALRGIDAEVHPAKDLHRFRANSILLLEVLRDEEGFTHSGARRRDRGGRVAARRAGERVGRKEMMSVALVTRPKSPQVSFMGRWSIWYTSPARWMIL